MKILGLTGGRLFAALVFGLLIAFTITYATVPHPVEVPLQAITSIPTPPPVVITEHPTEIVREVHTSVTLSEVWDEPMSEIAETTEQAFTIASLMVFVIAATMIIGLVTQVLRR